MRTITVIGIALILIGAIMVNVTDYYSVGTPWGLETRVRQPYAGIGWVAGGLGVLIVASSIRQGSDSARSARKF